MFFRGPGAFTFTTAEGFVRIELEPNDLLQVVVHGTKQAPAEITIDQELARWFRQHATRNGREIVLVALGWLEKRGELVATTSDVADVLAEAGLSGPSMHTYYGRLVKQGLCKRLGWGHYQLSKRGHRELERMRDESVDDIS